jgi:hypothetical protein
VRIFLKDNFRKPIGTIARGDMIEMKTAYRKNLFDNISLFIFLLMIFNSCRENREVLETGINNSELLLEQTDGQPERLFKSEEGQDDLGQADEFFPFTIRPRTPWPSNDDFIIPESLPLQYKSLTLLYKYDGYWSIRFGEYLELDDRNKNVSEYPFFDEGNINGI